MQNLASRMVFDSALERSMKAIALAYAHHMSDLTETVFVAVDYVAWVTGYSPRSVQVLTGKLVACGVLVANGKGERGVNGYYLQPDKLPAHTTFVPPPPAEYTPPVIDPNDTRRCAYCGSKPPLEKDHVIPRSRGGGNGADNLVWACSCCNNKKWARTPEEAGMPILFVEESRVRS